MLQLDNKMTETVFARNGNACWPIAPDDRERDG